MANRKALTLGQDMAKANATDAGNRMADMTGSQVDHFRLGHRTGLVADLRTMGDYGDAASRLVGSSGKREALEAVHGRAASSGLFDRLRAEQDAHDTWAAVRGQGMPSGPEAADRIAQQEQTLGNVGKGLLSAIAGQPVSAVRHVAAALADRPNQTAAVDERVASVLGSSDPAVVREALGGIRRGRVASRAAGARRTLRAQQGAKALGGRAGAGASTAASGEALLGLGDDDWHLYPVFGKPGTNLGNGYLPPDPNL